MDNNLPNFLFDRTIEQTGEKTFKAPDQIVQTVSGARSIFEGLRTNHLRRIQLYAQIEGLFQGNPPYNPEQLRAAGLAHIANFNDMSASAVLDRVTLMYWNLLYYSQSIIKFDLASLDPQAPHYAQIMSLEWDKAIRRYWPSFMTNYNSLTTQLAKFGLSPAFFPDERDPRWRMVELSRFYVPDQSQSDMDQSTTICIETEFTPQYLWGIYQQFKDSPQSEVPWDIAEIGRLLSNVANTTVGNNDAGPLDIFQLEKKIINRDMTFNDVFNESIRLVSLYQKEYDGKISHYMFHRYFDSGEFIFKEEGQYQSFSEALTIFSMNPGQFTLHGNRGIGHKIFSLAQAKIQQDCSVVDQAKWASSPIIKAPALSTKDADQIRFIPGVPINIGSYEFVQNNLGANLQGSIGVSEWLYSLIQNNINYSGTDPATPDHDAGSLAPTQVKLMAFREFSVLKNFVMHFYQKCDELFRSMTGKMWNSQEGYPGYEIAKAWKNQCLARGVPPEVFQNTKDKDIYGLPAAVEVFATRAAGSGSQVAQLLGLQELQTIAGSFGPREQAAYKEDFIMATLGPEALPRYMQGEQNPDETAGGASLAGVENAIAQQGQSPVFSPDNEHRSHVATHMGLLVPTVQAVSQQQMSPVDADRIFNVMIPHTQQHMQALQANPFAQEFYNQVRGPFEEVRRFGLLNRKNAAAMLQAQARKEQEQQAKQTQVMNEEQLKTMTTMNAERRNDIKLAAQSQRQQRAGAVKEAALIRKTEGDLAIKARQAEGEIAIEANKQNQKSAQEQIANINGSTPSPYDFEPPDGTPTQ
jgi:hypothetical protein